MQLFVIYWSISTGEDQLFATKEFCRYLNEGKIDQQVDGIELISIYHIPLEGAGVIICNAISSKALYKIFNMWRTNFNITFTAKPALSNKDLLDSVNEDTFW